MKEYSVETGSVDVRSLLEPFQERPFHVIGNNAIDPSKIGITHEIILKMYESAIMNRMLDNKILSLQRQGRLGPYIASIGEEGSIIGSAYALRPSDWLFSSYRELGAHLVRGLSIDLVLAQLFGNSNDLSKGRQMSNSWCSRELNIVPTAAPIGAYLPVAVGAALASKMKNDKIGFLTYFGDGATSSSDFHTAMNFAGVFKAPIVFFCRNNGWAISVPLSKQTAASTLAIKSIAYGFDGLRVDGNDALACYVATSLALEKARRGDGPTLIEAVTYRVGAHSTSDDPRRYRRDEEAKNWSARDPVSLLKAHLMKEKLWDEQKESSLAEHFEQIISKAVEQQEKTPPLPLKELIFEDVYESMPQSLQEQQKELLAEADRK